jgi:Tfp pilus assembly protein PilF
LFIFLYEWYFLQDLGRDWIRRKAKWGAAIAVVFVVLAVAFLGPNLLDRILGGYRFRDFTMWERVLTELRVVLFHLGLLALPHPSRLSLTHDFPLSRSLFDPVTTVLSLAPSWPCSRSPCGMPGRRGSCRSPSSVFRNLAIESSVIGLEIIFEHRTYLPSMFVIACSSLPCSLRQAQVGRIGPVVIAGVFSSWTHQRNAPWGDSLVFLRDALEKHDTMRNRTNLGLELMKRGSVDEALVHFEKAIAIVPDSAGTNRNMAEALLRKKRYEESLKYFRNTLALAREDKYRLFAHIGMASALGRLGRHAEAVKEYEQALAVDPRSEDIYNLLGKSLAEQGMHAGALEQFRKALAVNPASGDAYNAWPTSWPPRAGSRTPSGTTARP